MKADLLVKHAGQLLIPGKIIEDGALAASDGRIVAVGPSREVERSVTLSKKACVIDCRDRVVLPGFVDCHTHLVHAGSRLEEYEMKLQGKSYLEILNSGGGIHSTVRQTREAPAEALYRKAMRDLEVMLSHGTTTVEMKSGYGIDRETELKLLNVQKKLKQDSRLTLQSTHLAHVFPHDEKDRPGYIALQKEIISRAAREKLADCFDVFCDTGAFTLEESRELLAHAKSAGLALKVHAEQLSCTGAAELVASLGALSADHLEHISQKGIRALAGSGTVGVVLPGVAFHLREERLPPVRKMLDAGITLALATDYNPGSSPTMNMQFIIALACRLYRIPVLTAIKMATLNAAKAMGLADSVGSLETGKLADLILYDIEDYRELGCSFGTNMAKVAVKAGRVAGGRL